jgi:hypothetical protein
MRMPRTPGSGDSSNRLVSTLGLYRQPFLDAKVQGQKDDWGIVRMSSWGNILCGTFLDTF